ncbi:MAG: hypothetical protein ACI4HQ_04975 [Acetatifactor sp.]
MKDVKAYFTVEASLVMPLVISALLMTFFSFVYQYDRCLMEQDAGMLALYAATLKEQGEGEWKDKVSRRAAEWDEDGYLFWTLQKLDIGLKNQVVEIACGGDLMVPLPEWNLLDNDREWKTKITRKLTRLSPAEFIRLCRRAERSK